MSKKVFLYIICLFFIYTGVFAKQLTVLSFNVQNLFDAEPDGTEYKEYTYPTWNNEQYQKRLASIGKALQQYFTTSIDILALQEIEHEGVVADLQKYYIPHLPNMAVSSAPFSPVQVALLSRYHIVNVRQHQVQIPNAHGLRPVLEVILELPHLVKTQKKAQEQETKSASLQLLVVHLKSKRKSKKAMSPQEQRKYQYRLISNIIDCNIPTLVLGDFNDAGAQRHLQRFNNIKDKGCSLVEQDRYYVSRIQEGQIASYYYKGWIQLDHIFFDTVFQTLFSHMTFDVVDAEPFVLLNNSIKGKRPHAFVPHIKNYQAVSDHLPVLLNAEY